ncbi:hypothetical protein I7I51_03490 [Histoplasma capsulatum]|uniref:Uncharacterized protein n=1 Tax=Ajellomyces capsulatus TaxID=5037 RepID=A0A8A1MAX1_AJECA|nr:hypothetical protein I7I51_03490 [Histoplasma capsulatum]
MRPSRRLAHRSPSSSQTLSVDTASLDSVGLVSLAQPPPSHLVVLTIPFCSLYPVITIQLTDITDTIIVLKAETARLSLLMIEIARLLDDRSSNCDVPAAS